MSLLVYLFTAFSISLVVAELETCDSPVKCTRTNCEYACGYKDGYKDEAGDLPPCRGQYCEYKNNKCGVFLGDNLQKECFCKKGDLEVCETDKKSCGPSECGNFRACGQCDTRKHGVNIPESCFFDCDMNCVYEYKDAAADDKISHCVKYCDAVNDCIYVDKDRTHWSNDCDTKAVCENTCKPCPDCIVSKYWGACALDTTCVAPTCLSTHTISGKKAYCVKPRGKTPELCPKKSKKPCDASNCCRCKSCYKKGEKKNELVHTGKCYLDYNDPKKCVYDVTDISKKISFSRECYEPICETDNIAVPCAHDDECPQPCYKCCSKNKICHLRSEYII